MVQKGAANLDCDKECDEFKANQEKLVTTEAERKKQEELRAQQVCNAFHYLWKN